MQRPSLYSVALALMGVSLLGYLLARASLLSMTHDESGTTDFAVVPIAEIMFSPRQFETANNHILNSLLLKGTIALFGYQEWAIRLPNVLSFMLYFSACISIMQLLTKRIVLQLAGVLILCSMPYLMDFFALARGYGLANAFGIAALAALLHYVHKPTPKWLWICFSMAALACYANFTWFNLYLALWSTLLLQPVLSSGIRSLLNRNLLQNQLPPLSIGLLLALLSFKPISHLRTKDEFKWGTNSLLESLQTLAADLLYNQTLPFLNPEQSKNTVLVLIALLPVLVLTIAAIAWKNKRLASNTALQLTALAALVLVVMTAGIVAQRHVLGTFYIDGRKATLYIPLLLTVAAGCMVLLSQAGKAGKAGAFVLTMLLGAGFISSLNLYSCREWWYDANSKEVAYQLAKENNAVVALSWQFAPAFQFYNQHHLGNRITLIKTNEVQQPPATGYYYVMGDEIRNVPPEFVPVQRYFWDRFLLQKNPAAYRSQLYALSGRLQLNGRPAAEATNQAAAELLQQRLTLNWQGLFWTN